jgi:signal transduction histidine kinase
MSDESIYTALLRQQGFAVFEFLGEGGFRLVGEPAGFCTKLLGEEAVRGSTIRLGEKFPFLDNFLVDAEEVWKSSSRERAESGTWIENAPSGHELALEATALWLARKRVLLIQNPQEGFERRVQVLQTARDSILEHEKLLREIQKKEILLHCIVHDLSQPLTAMRGCFSLLALQPLSPDLKEIVEIAERQSEKQESMIRGILDAFSAELAAQQAVEKDPAKAPDLKRCAKSTVESFASAFAEHGARLELDPALDLSKTWHVIGEESRLLRIYGNLVENALRHAPADSTVTLGVSDEGQFLRAFVDDEGPGLPEDETADRLFALFAKGKEKRGGKAGLGLYFCKITVERWGGTIGCESRPSGGARFWFLLPRLQQG